MSRQIIVTLPVKSLEKSRAFFAGLGCSFKEQFCDHTAAWGMLSEQIHVMLMTHQKFLEFSPPGTEICDTGKHTQVLFSLSCESRQEVDQLFVKAVESGATTFEEAQDHGSMYGRSFQDLDGHGWQLLFMEQAAQSSLD